eukprot:790030-Pleurochrysis_carterae.AAC.1
MPETAFAAKVSMTASGDRDSDAPSGTASVPLRDHSKSDAAATEPAVSAEYMQEIARRKGHAERMAAQAEEILRVLSDECSQEDIARAVSEAVRGEEETPPWELAQRSANELSVAECICLQATQRRPSVNCAAEPHGVLEKLRRGRVKFLSAALHWGRLSLAVLDVGSQVSHPLRCQVLAAASLRRV